MRILLIDDDEKFRKDIQIWLTDTLKHTVGVAGSVDEAKRQLHQDRYHAILLDSHLRSSVDDLMDSNPRGGLEMLKYMSAAQVSQTVWVTAHNLDDLSVPASLGCNRFVFKSWRLDDETGQPSGLLYEKLQGHLDQLAVKRWDTFTRILGGSTIIIVATGIIWQMVEQSTPVLLAALVGAIVNFLSLLSILLGRPIYLLLRRRRVGADLLRPHHA